MSGFINHLLRAHFNTGQIVQPRLKGTFESYSPFQQVPATDAQQPFEPNSAPIQHETGRAPVNQQATRITGVPTGSFKGTDGNNETTPDQYIADDSHLLISPSKAAKPNAMKNDSPALPSRQPEINPLPAAEQVIDPIISNQQKIRTELPRESEFFTTPTATFTDPTLVDEAFVSKKNTVFSPILSALPGQGMDHQAPNNLGWVKAFKNIVNDQPQGNASIVEAQSVIKVNIGRIDVRAVTQQAPPRETAAPRPGISLSDFLKNKNGTKQ